MANFDCCSATICARPKPFHFPRHHLCIVPDPVVNRSSGVPYESIHPREFRSKPGIPDLVRMVRHRQSTVPNPLYTDTSIPGYSGFIPKFQFQIGHTFLESNLKSIANWDMENRMHGSQRCSFSHDHHADQLLKNMTCPRPVKNSSGGCNLRHPCRLHTQKSIHISPYQRENHDPQKTFIPGYTGFVPRHQFKYGGVFSAEVHQSLNEFTDGLRERSHHYRHAESQSHLGSHGGHEGDSHSHGWPCNTNRPNCHIGCGMMPSCS